MAGICCLVAGVATIPLMQFPAFRPYAVLLAVLALLSLVASLMFFMWRRGRAQARNRLLPDRGSSAARGRRTTVVVVAVVSLLLGGALGVLTATASLAVTPSVAAPSTSAQAAAAAGVAGSADALVELSAAQSQAALSAAQAEGYQTRSGLGIDWDRARVARYQDVTIAHVPLDVSGEAAPGNYVAFVLGDAAVTIDEVTMFLESPTRIHVQRWLDGGLLLDQVVRAPLTSGSSGGDNVVNGMNWSALNRCLLDNGIAQWVLVGLAVVCGAACAATAGLGCIACVSFAIGFWGGSVAACVRASWR